MGSDRSHFMGVQAEKLSSRRSASPLSRSRSARGRYTPQAMGGFTFIDPHSILQIRPNLSGLGRPPRRMSRGFSIAGGREYFPCGCFFVVDRNTGETVRSFLCEKHKFLEASPEKGVSERSRKRAPS